MTALTHAVRGGRGGGGSGPNAARGSVGSASHAAVIAADACVCGAGGDGVAFRAWQRAGSWRRGGAGASSRGVPWDAVSGAEREVVTSGKEKTRGPRSTHELQPDSVLPRVSTVPPESVGSSGGGSAHRSRPRSAREQE